MARKVHDNDSNTGELTIGFNALMLNNKGHTHGTIDYLHKISDTPIGELTAFTTGFGGVSLDRGKISKEFGIKGGLGLRW